MRTKFNAVNCLTEILREKHDINLSQNVIDFIYKKPLPVIEGIIRAVVNPNNKEIIQLFK